MEKILIIDDEHPVRRIIKRFLEKERYSCATAASAAEARDILKEDPYDLVLCDIRMPGESGLDFIQRDLAAYEDTAVIMVTGVDDKEVAESTFKLGAYDYIIKPIEPFRLLISVANALHRLNLERANRAYVEDLKRSHEERIQLEKFKGIVELSGTVCHELNQPLQILFGYTDLLAREIAEDHPLYQKILIIREQAERMRVLTSKIMGITRYETKEYATGETIIDLEKASSRD